MILGALKNPFSFWGAFASATSCGKLSLASSSLNTFVNSSTWYVGFTFSVSSSLICEKNSRILDNCVANSFFSLSLSLIRQSSARCETVSSSNEDMCDPSIVVLDQVSVIFLYIISLTETRITNENFRLFLFMIARGKSWHIANSSTYMRNLMQTVLEITSSFRLNSCKYSSILIRTRENL